MLTPQDTSDRFTSNPPQAAILPLACYEMHGQWLPPDIDKLIVDEVSYRVAEQLPFRTVLLPAWSYGTPPRQVEQPGAISLQPETLWLVVQDVVQSLFDQGIKQVVVINNHGSCEVASALPWGNAIVKTAIRQLNYEIPGLSAIWVQPFQVGRSRLQALFPGGVQTEVVEKSIADTLLSPGDEPGEAAGTSTILGKRVLEGLAAATQAYILNAFDHLAFLKQEK
jgi:creatinine amidohydrolase/Fe(II)-dependent formamide hydrolase-like protein